MTKKEKELCNLSLPKWPAMVVVPTTHVDLTREQIAEILIRTDYFQFYNEDNFQKKIAALVGVDVNSSEHWEQMDKARKEYGVLELDYLHNDRICSSWIYGMHGWLNWNGVIGTKNYNIGKWPSVDTVYHEWKLIAKTFPYLNLCCQLFNGEVDDENTVAVVEFNVSNGKVVLSEPKRALQPERSSSDMLVFEDRVLNGKRSHCTIEQFSNALKLTKESLVKSKKNKVAKLSKVGVK